jgi:hypothetical protein
MACQAKRLLCWSVVNPFACVADNVHKEHSPAQLKEIIHVSAPILKPLLHLLVVTLTI